MLKISGYQIYVVLLFCLVRNSFSDVSAQKSIIFYPDLLYRVENNVITNTSDHSFFHPQQVSRAQIDYYTDSLYGSRDKDLWHLGTNDKYVLINPVIQSSFSSGSSFLQHYAVGFTLNSCPVRNITVDLSYSSHFLSDFSLPGSRTDSAGIVYHWGKSVKCNSGLRFFHSLNGRITLAPLRFLNFQMGNDKQFWGDGYRSLFISDNAPPYPFFATILKFWRVQYVSMNTFMHDYKIDEYDRLIPKYTAMHALSWNVNKRLNLNIFETVIWYKHDSISSRSFDLNYLNPFIFYRPLEYNLGSPDNVLMGFGFKYIVGNFGTVYGQFLLDEYNIKEITRGKRWWGNKNAFQIGVKRLGLLGLRNLYGQLEYNQSRPFTYAHGYPMENYGYMLQSLAHPLGTNFRECVLILRYSKGRWVFNNVSAFARYGTEPGGKTVGADIYRSSGVRAKDYQNFIGQGITTNELTEEVKLSRVIQVRWGLMGEIGIRDVIQFLPEKKHQVYLRFGFKTLLYRDEKLY